MFTNDSNRWHHHQMIQLVAQNNFRLFSSSRENLSEVCERDGWSPEIRVAIEGELDMWERQQQEGSLMRYAPKFDIGYTSTQIICSELD